MPRGVIMSISGRKAVLLTEDSDFVKVVLPKGDYDIGQEIDTAGAEKSLINKWFVSGGRRLAAATAAVITAVVLPVAVTTIFINTVVYAYVTLDINPSTEFSINGRERIIKVKPLNDEGALVLEGTDLKGREIEYGIEYFVAKACELGYAAPGEEGAVIASTVMEKEENTELEQRISDTLKKSIEQNKLAVEAGVLPATKEIKEEAEKAGVSAGKYLIALQASEDQLEVDIEEVRNSSITSAIKKAGGDLQSILKRAHRTEKELKELLEKNHEKLKDRRNRDSDDWEKGNSGNNDKGGSGNGERGRGRSQNNRRDNDDKAGGTIGNNNGSNDRNIKNNSRNNGDDKRNEEERDGKTRRDGWRDKGSDRTGSTSNNGKKDGNNRDDKGGDKAGGAWNDGRKKGDDRDGKDSDNRNNGNSDKNRKKYNESFNDRGNNGRENDRDNKERVKADDRNKNRGSKVLEELWIHLFNRKNRLPRRE